MEELKNLNYEITLWYVKWLFFLMVPKKFSHQFLIALIIDQNFFCLP
jgi:hypothetical protein